MSFQTTGILNKRAIKVIITDTDAVLDTIDDQIHVFSPNAPAPTAPPDTIKVTLPCNPLVGEEHLIVANNANAQLDAGTDPIVGLGTPATVPAGTATRVVFSAEPDTTGGSGCNCGNSLMNRKWIAEGI